MWDLVINMRRASTLANVPLEGLAAPSGHGLGVLKMRAVQEKMRHFGPLIALTEGEGLRLFSRKELHRDQGSSPIRRCVLPVYHSL